MNVFRIELPARYNSRVVAKYLGLLPLFVLIFAGAKSAFKPAYAVSTTPRNVGDSFFPLVYPHMLFGNEIDPQFYFYGVLYFVFSALVGFALALKLNFLSGMQINAKVGTALLTGFGPGYLVLVAVNRLTAYLIPEPIVIRALILIYAFSMLAALIVVVRELKTQKSYSILRIILYKIFSIITLGIFLVIQIQTDLYNGLPIHIIGDSAIFNATYLETLADSDRMHVQLFAQHYDEILYLVPVSFLSRIFNSDLNVIDWLWITYAFMKASAIVWVTYSIKILFKNVYLSLLISLFLFFGNIFINPLTSPLINDSASNLASSSHSGRLLITTTAIFLFMKLLANDKTLLRKNSKSDLVLLLVLGLASASLTSSFIFIIACTFGAWLLISYLKRNISSYLLMYLGLFILVAMNLGRNSKLSAVLVLLLAMLILAALDYKSLVFDLGKLKSSAALPALLIFSLGFAIQSFLFGNLFSKLGRKLLGLDVSDYQGRDISAGFGGLGNNPFLFDGRNVMQHQISVLNFFQHYGFPIFYLAFALAIAMYLGKFHNFETQKLLVVGLFLLILSFFLWNDLNGGGPEWMSVWVKSRLVEPTFYILVILVLKYMFDLARELNSNSKVIHFFVSAYLVLSLLGPWPGGMLGQTIKNLSWLIERFS
jgi:hypothetical protein